MNQQKHSRRIFLKTLGITTVSLSVAPSVFSETDKSKPLNILWITSEDTSPDFACYGTPVVKTPNVDKLAAQGTRFTNAFVTCPVCSPARSAFMTGMYQTSIGAHHHRSHRKDGYTLPEPVEVITEYFRQAGYFTANVKTPAPNVKGSGKTDFNFSTKNKKPYDGTDWNQRKEGQPFFAHVNLKLTHRNFVRDPQNPIDPEKVEIPPYYPDHPVTRKDWADYLESIQVLDGQIGKVLDRIDDEDLAENTVVIYFGDHGRAHVRGKQWLYEGGIKIPLIVRLAGTIKAGSVVDDLVSTIDLAPTSLALAGIKPPKHLQGEIFLGENAKKRNYIFAARDRCDETVDRIRCVRTKRYKLIKNFYPERPYMQFNAYKTRQYPVVTLLEVMEKQGKLTDAQKLFMAKTRPEEELYDLKNDPYEINNIAKDPKYKDILAELSKELENWIERTGDKGRIPEDDPKGEFKKYQENKYKQDMKKKGLTVESSPEEHLKWWEKKLFGKVGGNGRIRR